MIRSLRATLLLSRARRSLRQVHRLYRKKASGLNRSDQELLKSQLVDLQSAIVGKKADLAKTLAAQLESSAHRLLQKNSWEKSRDFILGLVFALCVAIPIRQMWFEFYTIPSGSMRPTLKEADALIVSKTDFGMNTLTTTSHLYFDPTLVKRGEIVIFSVDHMDVQHSDTMYFYIIPGKKQFIKRLIGKPGDTLYFYGGKIYGIDEAGKDLVELRDTPWFKPLEHIPFIRLEGDAYTPQIPLNGVLTPVTFSQMGDNVARLSAHVNRTITGEMLVPHVQNYYDLWGFKNFATARITNANDQFFLELTHHPSLQNAKIGRDYFGRLRPELSTTTSQLPLDQETLSQIMKHMTTARFTIKNGKAFRHGATLSGASPSFDGIQNGTYEILDGKLYRILWAGLSYRLSDTHPLLKSDAKNVQKLYNLGIEFNAKGFETNRYAYFRDGALYLMGSPILQKGSQQLEQFTQKEKARINGFIDAGAPLKPDGSLDQEIIRKFGITIPPGSYLVLGDNHAMSGDSRQFGFVPAANLRGGASLVLWPPGPRWGRLPQPSLAHLTLPNVVVWVGFLGLAVLVGAYYRYKAKQPLKLE